MKSLIIPMATLSLLKASLSIPLFGFGIVSNVEEVSPVENEELFDHLFVHDDHKFNRSGNQFFADSYSVINF